MQKILLLFLVCLFVIPSQAQWKQLNDAPFETHHTNGFGFNGKGYVIKGTPNQGQNQFWEYDAQNDNWSLIGSVDGPSRTFSIGDDMDGKYYFGFGSGKKDLWVFDPADNSFTELPECPCEPRAHPAFVAYEGKIYMGTGSGNNSDLRDWWIYDVEMQTWTQKADVPGGNRHHPFQFAIGEDIFVGGGHRSNWIKYNIPTESWTEINDFPQGRVAGTQFSHNDIGFVLSGDNAQHNILPDNQFLMYFPEEDEWYELPFDDHMHRWAPSSFIIGDDLYYFGGETSVGNDDSDMWTVDLNTLTCLAPAGFSAVTITENSAGVIFDESPTGSIDTLQWRETGTDVWNNVIDPNSIQQIEGLNACTEYEFRFYVGCAGNGSLYSDIQSFLTKGCGACVDFSYCDVTDEFSSKNAYVERVKIDNYENTTGDNDGYQSFTESANAVEVELGQTINIEVEPAYIGFVDEGNLKIWIDLDADGEFEDNEVMAEQAGVMELYTGTIEIPLDAILGLTRMRIIYDINDVTNPCEGGFVKNGEVEDYCLVIAEMTSANTEIDHASKLSIYPNPTNGKIYIDNEALEILTVSVFDVNGKLLLQKLGNESVLDVSGLVDGIYVVKITSEESAVFRKLIKQ